MEQETLEEAAEQFEYTDGIYGFKQGAKWQQERSYSEEEVKEIVKIAQSIKNYGDYKPFTFEECIEQFKKK